MSILTSPSGAFPISLVYITAGTLIDIWTIVAWIYYPPDTAWDKFWLVGFMVTGFALLVIGLLLGPIGRAARHAELPPAEVTPAVTSAEQTAAANPPVVVPSTAPVQGGMSPVMVPPSRSGEAANTSPIMGGSPTSSTPTVSPPTSIPGH